MLIRHLVTAALLIGATAAGASPLSALGQPGESNGARLGGNIVPMPAQLELDPLPSPVLSHPDPVATPPVIKPPVVTAPGPVVSLPGSGTPAASEVPEPASLALILAGVAAAGALRRRHPK